MPRPAAARAGAASHIAPWRMNNAPITVAAPWRSFRMVRAAYHRSGAVGVSNGAVCERLGDMSGAFAKERLARMHRVMAGYVERSEMPGLVTVLCRRDEVHVDAIGAAAIGGAPMRRDTIFRI